MLKLTMKMDLNFTNIANQNMGFLQRKNIYTETWKSLNIIPVNEIVQELIAKTIYTLLCIKLQIS